MIDNKTPHLELPLPNLGNQQDEDVPRIGQAFEKLDEHAQGMEGQLAEVVASIQALEDGVQSQWGKIVSLSAAQAQEVAVRSEADGKLSGRVEVLAVDRDSLASRVSGLEALEGALATRLGATESQFTALSTTMIGSVFAHTASATYVPNGCVPADAAEYAESQFPTFYTDYLASGRLITCTYAEFAAQIAATGNCAKFAVDPGARTFRVPLYKDGDSITQAASAAELGKSYKAGLPNITANFGTEGGNTSQISGAAYRGPNGAVQAYPNAGSYSTQMFDASRSSRVYGNSTTVIDEQVRLRHFVVLASAQNNASVFDWSNYMTALAGKANNDLSNLGAGSGDVIRNNTSLRPIATRTTAGTWTITGVTVGRALVLGMGSTIESERQLVSFQITSGAAIGSATYSPKDTFAFGRTGGYISAPSCVIKPTKTTVVVDIRIIDSGITLYAEQI